MQKGFYASCSTSIETRRIARAWLKTARPNLRRHSLINDTKRGATMPKKNTSCPTYTQLNRTQQGQTPGESLRVQDPSPQTRISWATWRMILSPRPSYKIGLLILSLLAALLGVASPYFQKIFIDTLTLTPTPQHLATWTPQVSVFSLLLLAFTSAALGHVCQATANLLGNLDAAHTQHELAQKLYDKTLSLRTSSLQGRTVGEIVSVYATDVPGATALIENTLPWGASVLFPLITAPIAVSLVYDLPLHFILSVIGATTAVNVALSRLQSGYFSRFKSLAAQRTALVNTWIQNIRTLRVLGWVEYFEGLIFSKRQEETENRVRMVTNGQIMNTLASSVTFILNILAIITLIQARRGQVTPGELMGLLWILGVFLTRPFRTMPWLFTFTLDGVTSLRRLQGFFDLQNPRDELTSSRAAKQASAFLQVHDLNLKTERETTRLNSIEFDVKQNEFVTIVGEVGSGKSLLLQSLLGENNATFTTYYIQEQDLLQKPRSEWKSFFSFVPQEGFIMNSSLRDNVAFTYNADQNLDSAIVHSLRLSQLTLGEGGCAEALATEIGERGINLSGGQRQRVNLARAHHHTRSIILMDDCLSALDVDTERAVVRELLLQQWRDRTRILVTHRLSVLPLADRVFFMQERRLVGQGPFTKLLAQSQDFANFVASLQRQEGEREAQTSKGKPQP